MHTNSFRIASSLVAVGAMGAAAVTSHFAFVVVAMVATLFAATSLSVAGRGSTSLRYFVKQPVLVHVWGAPLSHEPLTITSLVAIGPGLHLYLRGAPNAPCTHLKVAQPTPVQVAGTTAFIQSAKYIQWAGRSLPKAPDVVALTLSLAAPPQREATRTSA